MMATVAVCPSQTLYGDVAVGGQDWLASLTDNTLQLVTSDAGCFDAEFPPAGVVQNDVGGFRAVTDR